MLDTVTHVMFDSIVLSATQVFFNSVMIANMLIIILYNIIIILITL